MPKSLNNAFNFFASLKLTAGCLVVAMVLILMSTFAQVHHGIFYVKQTYFDTFFLWWMPPGYSRGIPYFPGGFLVGGVLLLNLLAAHFKRFKLETRKLGMWLVHGGLILLIAGMFFSSVMTIESRLELDEGQSKNWSESPYDTELVVIDTTSPDYDDVVSFPSTMFGRKELSHASLPFSLSIKQYFPNSSLFIRQPDAKVPALAEFGAGAQIVAAPEPLVTANGESNTVTLVVEPLVNGKPQGTIALSNGLGRAEELEIGGRRYRLQVRETRYYLPFTMTLRDFRHDKYAGSDIERNFSSLVTVTESSDPNGRDHLISMNHPLRLEGKTFYQAQFRNDNRTSIFQVVENPGWLVPYISCSLIAGGLLLHFLLTLSRYLRRRAAGAPSALGPDAISAGSGPRSGSSPTPAPTLALNPTTTPLPDAMTEQGGGLRWLSWFAAIAAGLFVLSGFLPARSQSYNLEGFASLPVLLNGRIKPLDTVARNSLLAMRGKQTILVDGNTVDSTTWLLDTLARPDVANSYPVFMINHPEVLALFGFNPDDGRFYSFAQLYEHLPVLEEKAALAEKVKADERSPFQKAVFELYNHVTLYHRLRYSMELPGTPNGMSAAISQYTTQLQEHRSALLSHNADDVLAQPELRPLLSAILNWQELAGVSYLRVVPPLPTDIVPGTPPPEGEDPAMLWLNPGDALLAGVRTGTVPPTVAHYAALLDGWKTQNPDAFNSAIESLRKDTGIIAPSAMRKVGHEVLFNRSEPFYHSLVLYVVGFLLAAIGWLVPKGRVAVLRSAFAVIAVAFVFHSIGLVARVYIQGYAPVTNLYSSAVFVGWAAALLGLVLERLHRNGIGSAAAGTVGFSTLVIAHNLAKGGDTMEMMRAVLDSNFWLSTHVVTVTIGYSGMFLCGLLAIAYILLGVFTTRLNRATQHSLTRMIYGVLCFSTLLSFIGTVLGGIWADQSWGRFWGWDPKENGAMLIVLWCAFMLHSRWDGLLKDRGLAVAAVFGNIVTAFSWFGTNMLSVGLHSYGFTEKGFVTLTAFIVSQLVIIAIGLLPLQFWRSMARRPAPKPFPDSTLPLGGLAVSANPDPSSPTAM